jgi:hypothetical protein
LPTLAQAWVLTRDPRYAGGAESHLEAGSSSARFRWGPNWSSALEAGLRPRQLVARVAALGGAASPLFEASPARLPRRAGSCPVYQHAEFVNGHYSLHSSANNHLIGEAAGVFIASMAWPHWEPQRRLAETARAILEREALLQNAPDGVNREQSTSYQQWTFDLLLLPLLAARANGDDFPPEYARASRRCSSSWPR